jgi:TRAP-type C4-dicarboxylate transport system permease small subunit
MLALVHSILLSLQSPRLRSLFRSIRSLLLLLLLLLLLHVTACRVLDQRVELTMDLNLEFWVTYFLGFVGVFSSLLCIQRAIIARAQHHDMANSQLQGRRSDSLRRLPRLPPPA